MSGRSDCFVQVVSNFQVAHERAYHFCGGQEKKRRSEATKLDSFAIPTGMNSDTKTPDAPNMDELYCDNPSLQLVPLFFKISPDEISGDSPQMIWRELVKNEMVNHPKIYGSPATGKDFDETLYAMAEKVLEGYPDKPFITKDQYIDALHKLRSYNGLRFENHRLPCCWHPHRRLVSQQQSLFRHHHR